MPLLRAVAGVLPLPAAAMQASMAASTFARAALPPLAPFARAGSVTRATSATLAATSAAEAEDGSRASRKAGRAAGRWRRAWPGRVRRGKVGDGTGAPWGRPILLLAGADAKCGTWVCTRTCGIVPCVFGEGAPERERGAGVASENRRVEEHGRGRGRRMPLHSSFPSGESRPTPAHASTLPVPPQAEPCPLSTPPRRRRATAHAHAKCFPPRFLPRFLTGAD